MRTAALVLLPVLALAACSGSSPDEAGTAPAVDAAPDGTTEAAVDGAADSSIDTAADTTDSTADDAADAVVEDTEPADAADAAPTWPSCDAKPDAATTRSIPEIWAADPSTPSFTWVSGATVTAVSKNGCVADDACQIFLQAGTGTTLEAVAKHAIKLFVSKKTASRFTGIAVGDTVDVAAYAIRYTLDGQNELLLEVNDALRGCAKKTGTGTIAPVAATLDQLGSVSAYESTYGPVLVTVSDVSGKPDASASAIFGLWNTAGFDAGATGIVSLSPYFLPGATFTGLVAGTKTDFASITGVFGLFMPAAGGDAGAATKYLVIYPRTMSEVVKK